MGDSAGIVGSDTATTITDAAMSSDDMSLLPFAAFANRHLLASGIQSIGTCFNRWLIACMFVGVYISGFDKTLFAEISAEYGIPFVVSALLAGWFLSQASWNFGLIPGAISLRSWALYASGWALERWLLIIVLWLWVLIASPFVFIVLWGVMVYCQQ
jgi:hypothetical protein